MAYEQKIRKKMEVISIERSLLEDYVGLTFDEFIAEDFVHSYYAALHHLQVALQAVLDIGQHIIAHEVFEKYKENKEVFRVLARHGVISEETSAAFQKAIGTRNILVHQYEDVDPRKIYEIIQNDLGDFDKFIAEIADWLERRKV